MTPDPRPLLILCECNRMRWEHVWPHAPRWVVREGRRYLADCMGREVGL